MVLKDVEMKLIYDQLGSRLYDLKEERREESNLGVSSNEISRLIRRIQNTRDKIGADIYG